MEVCSVSSDVSVESDSDTSCCEDVFPLADDSGPIEKFELLIALLDKLFASSCTSQCKLKSIVKILHKVDLTTTEINKFTFFDLEKPYITFENNYIESVWNAGMESKIHNHPCDGCFIKTIRGCIKETLYCPNADTNEIKQISNKFYCEGQVSYMNDDLGLHKIGNPNKDLGSVTLHLYTPPFGSCKVTINPYHLIYICILFHILYHQIRFGLTMARTSLRITKRGRLGSSACMVTAHLIWKASPVCSRNSCLISASSNRSSK